MDNIFETVQRNRIDPRFVPHSYPAMASASGPSGHSGIPPSLLLRLYALPRELLDNVLLSLDPESYINFVFADYHSAWLLGLVPRMTPRMFLQLQSPPIAPGLFQTRRLPNELLMIIIRAMSRRDMINFVLANYHDLRQRSIAPRLTQLTLFRMRSTFAIPSIR